MKLRLIILAFLFCSIAEAQTVTTIFNSSTIQVDDAIIQDSHGNIYGSHYVGSNVYKITPSGSVSIFKSGIGSPNGLAFDSQDNLYIADNTGNRVYKVDTAGNTIFFISVASPSGIIKEIDSDTMIITQYSGHRVRKIAPDGTLMLPFHSGSPLNGPVGLTYGSDSVLYIGNFTDREIYKSVNDSLVYVATIPGNFNVNLGFITQANGLLYGTSFQTDKIYEINPNIVDSVRVFAGSLGGNTDGNISVALFNDPNGIYASKGGDSLLISDFATGNIRMITGLVTGIYKEKIIKTNTNLYPNPSVKGFRIESESPIHLIEIYSITGQLIYTEKVNQEREIEVLRNIKEGNHILKIHTSEGVQTKKLIQLR